MQSGLSYIRQGAISGEDYIEIACELGKSTVE